MLFTDVKVILSTEANSINIDVSLNSCIECLSFVVASAGCYPAIRCNIIHVIILLKKLL